MTTKDPIAAELGRRGGIKGGKARSMSLSPERRRDIARRAAAARWGTKSPASPAEVSKASLPGVGLAVRRGTMQFAERSFEVFALSDGRQVLGLLSVEAALAADQPTAPPALAADASIVTFKEAGSWQVLKGLMENDFLAICRRRVHEVLHSETADLEFLERVFSILLDCASEGLKRRMELALQPS
jgi:hypothetical protein